MHVSQSAPETTPREVLEGKYILCGYCAAWLPIKEGSIQLDFGICPKRFHPNNYTSARDGCREGVPPKE